MVAKIQSTTKPIIVESEQIEAGNAGVTQDAGEYTLTVFLPKGSALLAAVDERWARLRPLKVTVQYPNKEGGQSTFVATFTGPVSPPDQPGRRSITGEIPADAAPDFVNAVAPFTQP